MSIRVYGYYNNEACYSAEEYITKCRGFGRIEDDEQLLKFAEKVTSNWLNAGWRRTFETFYLDCYDVKKHFLPDEFARLLELQEIARKKAKDADKAREWKLIGTYCYTDNSEEEVWEDKDGIRKTVMKVYPHGD